MAGTPITVTLPPELESFIEERVADNPGIGHVRIDLTDADVRFWSVFKYLVIYRPQTKPLESSVCCMAGAT